MASLLAGFLLPFFVTSPVLSQALPGPGEPSGVDRRFQAPPAPAPRPDGTSAPERAAPSAPADAEEIRFVLRGLALEGVTIYEEKDLLPIFQPYFGKEISLKDLYDLAEQITRRYGRDGYILSQALVPAQKIENGIAAIEVVEGYIDRVLVEGSHPGDEDILKQFTDKIAAERPLRAKTLERYLLLMSDLPGFTARGVMRPSPKPGAADLVVLVEHKMADGFASVDNRGTRYLGPVQISSGANLNGAFGKFERLGLRYITTGQPNELKYVDGSYEQPIGGEGWRANVSVNRSVVKPGYGLKPRQIDANIVGAAAGISKSLIRSRGENFSWQAKIDAKNVITDENSGASVISEDRLRSIRTGFSYDFVDTAWGPAVTLAAAELSQGVDALGARKGGSAHLSRTGGHSDYTKITGDLQRLQSLGGGFNLLLAATGQYAFSTLLSGEEFSLGGSQFGRAFDSSELSGEHGLAGKVELQYGADTKYSLLQGYQYYGFYDLGAVWNRDPGANEHTRRYLASAGLGVRLNFTQSLSGSLEMAKPVANRVRSVSLEHGQDPRLFFLLVGRF